MKNIKPLLVLLSFVSFFSLQAQTADEKAVASAVDKLIQNILEPNKEALESLVIADLSYGHSSGTIQTKATFMDDLLSGKTDYTQAKVTNQTIKVVGNFAIVRHNLDCVVNGSTIPLGILLVWVKQGNDWKLMARQAFKR